MPNPTITTAYAGENTAEILQLMVLGNEAITKGSFFIHEDVQRTKLITRGFVSANPIRPYQSMPADILNGLSFTERSMTPVRLMIFDTINPMDFQQYWREYQPTGPLVDKVLDPAIPKVIIELYSKQVNNQLGALMWSGNVSLAANDPLAHFNGIVVRALADAATIKPADTGVLTSANIIAGLKLVDDAIPDALYEDPDMVIHVSTAVARLYADALSTLANKGPAVSDVNALKNLTYKGREIRSYSRFPNANIMAAKASTSVLSTNLHAAVNMADDQENLKIERFRPEGDNYFIKASFMMDVNYGFSEEIVISKAS